MTSALERYLALRNGAIADGPGGDAAGLCRRLSDALDDALRELAARHSDVAVIAVGGYGRREQCIFSDVDLTLVHHDQVPARLAQDVLYPLWNAGLAVGHSVRTVAQTAAAMRDSFETRCALLSARLVSGPASLHEAVVAAVIDVGRSRPLRPLLTTEIRRRRAAEPHQLLEPDLKNGRGGLRTFQALAWQRTSAGDTGEPERETSARATLLAARNALHAARARKSEVFTRELHDTMAQWLGTDRTTLATGVYQAMRTADRMALTTWPEVAYEPDTDRIGAAGRRVLRSIRTRFGASSLTAAGASPPLRSAAQALTRSHGPLLDEAARMAIATSGPPEWSADDRAVLVQLLGGGERGRDVWAALDELGWVDRALPELSHVRALPQVAPFHAHPADTHMWRTADEMLRLVAGDTDDPWTAQIAEELGATDHLLLGAFLHDVGKGLGARDHAVAGAELTERLSRRIGFGPATTATISAAVRDHLFLANVASRRDIDDVEVIDEVAARVGDLRSLQTLYLVTLADLRATGPGMHTTWRVSMLARLFARTAEVFGHGVDLSSDEDRIAALVARPHPGLDAVDVREHLAAMTADYMGAYPDDQIIAHARLATPVPAAGEIRLDVTPGPTDRATIVGRDIAGFASVVAGVLALHNISVVNARFNTRSDGVAIDTFDAIDVLSGGAVDPGRWERVRRDLPAALGSAFDLEGRLASKARAYGSQRPSGTRLRIRVGRERGRTMVQVRAADRIGLLHDILKTLHDLQLDLDLARIDTRAGEAIDTFYVRGAVGGPLGAQDRLLVIEQTLRRELGR